MYCVKVVSEWLLQMFGTCVVCCCEGASRAVCAVRPRGVTEARLA